MFDLQEKTSKIDTLAGVRDTTLFTLTYDGSNVLQFHHPPNRDNYNIYIRTREGHSKAIPSFMNMVDGLKQRDAPTLSQVFTQLGKDFSICELVNRQDVAILLPDTIYEGDFQFHDLYRSESIEELLRNLHPQMADILIQTPWVNCLVSYPIHYREREPVKLVMRIDSVLNLSHEFADLIAEVGIKKIPKTKKSELIGFLQRLLKDYQN